MASHRSARAKRRATAKPAWRDHSPFHVVARKINGAHVGYDIYCKNRPFLRQVAPLDAGEEMRETPRLKRHEAYALARVLNEQRDFLKWADKFGDPYVE